MDPTVEAAFELIRKELRETEPCFCTSGVYGVDGCPAEALNRKVGELLGETLRRPLRK